MSWIESLKTQFDFDQLAWIPLESPKSFEYYQTWLDRGHAGEMTYLERHGPKKRSPRDLLPEAQSVIMVAKTYVPVQRPHGQFTDLRVAAYAQNFDYHHWFHQDLSALAQEISKQLPGVKTLVGTDSMAFLERDFGAQAQLGWVGKNTCLIHPQKGSFFFLGEILTTHALESSPLEPLPDFCGTCTRCLEVCPTEALESPRRLNATKCISYWTIESKTIAPEPLREKFGDWFFGCDLCQSVCPWNQKPFRGQPALDTSLLKSEVSGLVAQLRQVLNLPETELKLKIKGTPFERSKPFGLRRNAMYVIGNRRVQELRSAVEPYVTDEKLGELARWTLAKLDA